MLRFLMLFTVGVAAYASPLAGQTWTPEQQEIWRLEEQQWKLGAAKDASWIQTMVHLEFSGIFEIDSAIDTPVI